MSFLNYAYGCTILLGPFVDDTDGKTAETGLAGTMTVYLSKNGAASAARESVGAITHDRSGYYRVPLSVDDVTLDNGYPATDLVAFASPAGALPVYRHFTVADSYFWDALYGSGGVPADLRYINGEITPVTNLEAALDGTGYDFDGCEISADVVKLSGDAAAADNAEAFFDGTGYDATDNVIGADVLELKGSPSAATNLTNTFNGTGYGFTNVIMPSNVVQIGGSTSDAERFAASVKSIVAATVRSGTITAALVPLTYVHSHPSNYTDMYKDRWAFFTSGTLVGQAQKITGYNATTNSITVAGFTTAPSVGDSLVII